MSQGQCLRRDYLSFPSPAFDTANGGLPNIILLHIGTNDSGTYSATQMASDLEGLLDQITTAAPNALVVVAQIVPLGYGDNAVIKAYNQAIPGIVDAQVAAPKHSSRWTCSPASPPRR